MLQGYDKKRVLITGGLGMLGSTLAHILVENGADVTILDACLQPFGANLVNIEDIKDDITLVMGDIRDKAAMRFIVRNKDVIFNLAAQVSHNDSLTDPILDASINYMGHLTVLDAVKNCAPEAVIVHTGSRLQYGKVHELPVKESHPLNPLTPYAFNKTVAERMYRFWHKYHDIRTIMLRISNPYGKRCQMKHSKYSIVNHFIHLAMEGKDLTIYGDGNQTRDYIYADDVAYAILLTALSEQALGKTLNIGSGVATRFKDMAETVARVVGSGSVKYVPWPEEYVNVETGDFVMDISSMKQLLEWQPTTTLDAGVSKTHEFYLENLEHYI